MMSNTTDQVSGQGGFSQNAEAAGSQQPAAAQQNAPSPGPTPSGAANADSTSNGGDLSADDVIKDFPEMYQMLIKTELDYLAACRTATCELLKEQVDAEKEILKKQQPPQSVQPAVPQAAAQPGAPAAAPAGDGNGQGDSNDMAVLWYARLKRQLQKQEADLKAKAQAADGAVKTQAEQAKSWKADIDELVKETQASPAEKDKAQKAVDQLKKDLQAAKDQGAMARAQKLTRDLEQAQAYLDSLTQDPAAAKQLLQDTITGWRGARTQLAMLKAGKTPPDGSSWEELQIQLKIVQKLLDYVKQYQDVLVEEYLRQQPGSALKPADQSKQGQMVSAA
jgi:DNA repair exonuclease SbcCD ATPase subunit